MDFDSPDVMKDFPGLYASDLNKKCSNESDYSDEVEKVVKKETLIGKRKDKKDKERGYAALGESSDEGSRSPSKSKKSKSFKFSSKSKEKREKSRDKENPDRKDREKKVDKKLEKEKSKKNKNSVEDTIAFAEALPIFGVSLEISVERSRCHDGVDLPLPIRECIDYVESDGISFEGVYKISGTKTKVSQIKKMYNLRENVKLSDYDVPTATSLLKMFLRDLPEPIFTNDLLIRFEEAGAILNFNTREKHLKILVENLPPLNKLLLSWLIVHLHNVSINEKQNKMSKHNIASALNHTFHVSSRLLQALLQHSSALFPNIVIYKYIPPVKSCVQLPDRPQQLEMELKKQESLLSQIHNEMNVGCISKEREEKLWEVQRIITQLKRKMKTVQKIKNSSQKCDEDINNEHKIADSKSCKDPDIKSALSDTIEYVSHSDTLSVKSQPTLSAVKNEASCETTIETKDQEKNVTEHEEFIIKKNDYLFDDDIILLTYKRNGLIQLKEQLTKDIHKEKIEIDVLKGKIDTSTNQTIPPKIVIPKQESLDQIMTLLQNENKILQIKKINLVRKIIEQKELCIEFSAQLRLMENEKYSNF
ncbi:ralA-binding protein 1 [Diorhabda carinulata]|uniref:ralA-binding protein 1 n=1 Tax=Diorhabda carinulata TaxID=1163345 RepID=UPI0025A0E7DA|nr:ralA-binding protein 1 [Diorhabda carinulata]